MKVEELLEVLGNALREQKLIYSDESVEAGLRRLFVLGKIGKNHITNIRGVSKVNYQHLLAHLGLEEVSSEVKVVVKGTQLKTEKLDSFIFTEGFENPYKERDQVVEEDLFRDFAE